VEEIEMVPAPCLAKLTPRCYRTVRGGAFFFYTMLVIGTVEKNCTSSRELARKLGVDRRLVDYWITRLVEMEYIRRDVVGKQKYTYRIL
jgi:hypothetical protein